MTREQLTVELTALEKAGQITPTDRNEVEKFADYLAEAARRGKAGDPGTWGDLYDEMYSEPADPQQEPSDER